MIAPRIAVREFVARTRIDAQPDEVVRAVDHFAA
jgi:hypothetical protein